MPIEIKLSDVDVSKVEKALKLAEKICQQCGGTEHPECYMHLVIKALQSFLEEKEFDLSINWKYLHKQQEFSKIKMQELLFALENICLHCGVYHIDACFINVAIQAVQLLFFGKIIERSKF